MADTSMSGSTSTRILSGKLPSDQLKRSNAFGFVSHKGLLLISVPPTVGLVEAVYNLARMLASDRSPTLGRAFGASRCSSRGAS
jgi:hypothetical protein